MADGTDLISRIRAMTRERQEQDNQSFNLDVLAERMRTQRQTEGHIVWDSTVHIDNFDMHYRIDFKSLVSAIEKYNNDIIQGFTIGEKIDYNPTLLETVIEHYNNLINKVKLL